MSCLAVQPTELEPPPYDSIRDSVRVNDALSGEDPKTGIDAPAAPVFSSQPEQQSVRFIVIHIIACVNETTSYTAVDSYQQTATFFPHPCINTSTNYIVIR